MLQLCSTFVIYLLKHSTSNLELKRATLNMKENLSHESCIGSIDQNKGLTCGYGTYEYL